MTFEIEVAGTRRAVSIESPGPGTYRIVVDGQPYDVRAERAGAFDLSLVVDEATGRSCELSVAPGAAPGELLVGLGGRSIGVSVNGRRRRGRTDAAVHPDGDQPVIAPMPGRVVRVLVSIGEQVDVRQGVVVVEAMKMENELRSPKAGRVKEVAVAPGSLVEAGRVLLIIE
jgi:biotin carboxyl carrier protein